MQAMSEPLQAPSAHGPFLVLTPEAQGQDLQLAALLQELDRNLVAHRSPGLG